MKVSASRQWLRQWPEAQCPAVRVRGEGPPGAGGSGCGAAGVGPARPGRPAGRDSAGREPGEGSAADHGAARRGFRFPGFAAKVAPPPPGPGSPVSARLGDRGVGATRASRPRQLPQINLQVTSSEVAFPAIDLKGGRS